MVCRPERTALAILALYHLVQNRLLVERGYVQGNLAVAGVLVGVGRSAGLTWEEMGLGPARFRTGLALGARVSVAIVAMVALALAHPGLRPYLRDDRARVGSAAEVCRRALIRFPLGTALFEEVAFRGVLPALLGRRRRPAAAHALSAGVFALWHLIPTARAIEGNPVRREVGAVGRTTAVVGGSALAGTFGLGFSALRRRSGTVAAPWLVHAALNSLSFLAGVIAWRRA